MVGHIPSNYDIVPPSGIRIISAMNTCADLCSRSAVVLINPAWLMQCRQWEDQSGNKRESWDLQVGDIVNHSPRSQSEQSGEVNGNGAVPVVVVSEDLDDTDPFSTD